MQVVCLSCLSAENSPERSSNKSLCLSVFASICLSIYVSICLNKPFSLYRLAVTEMLLVVPKQQTLVTIIPILTIAIECVLSVEPFVSRLENPARALGRSTRACSCAGISGERQQTHAESPRHVLPFARNCNICCSLAFHVVLQRSAAWLAGPDTVTWLQASSLRPEGDWKTRNPTYHRTPNP